MGLNGVKCDLTLSRCCSETVQNIKNNKKSRTFANYTATFKIYLKTAKQHNELSNEVLQFEIC